MVELPSHTYRRVSQRSGWSLLSRQELTIFLEFVVCFIHSSKVVALTAVLWQTCAYAREQYPGQKAFQAERVPGNEVKGFFLFSLNDSDLDKNVGTHFFKNLTGRKMDKYLELLNFSMFMLVR